MQTKQQLLNQRNRINQSRENLLSAHGTIIKQDILSSWQRSNLAQIPQTRLAAPLADQAHLQNTLTQALNYCGHELKQIAEQSDMVVAVGDIGSTIIWSAAQGKMQKAAEKVHFVAGGQWGEECVGTNALALSIKTQQSCCVFSNEHYMPSVQDWVCYAAPIIDPYSKNILGVIDLSTTWDRHNTLGLLAVERCAAMIQNALQQCQTANIFIHTFATPQVLFNGHYILLTPRQIEIVTILALHPRGMNLEMLHQALYGERQISVGTLKAEMSQLKKIFGDALGSRPYRLMAKIEADFLQVEQALDKGYFVSALQLYTGVFLAKTESPFLCAWRDSLESRLSNFLYQAKETDVLLKHLARFPEAVEAVDRLMELFPVEHPAYQVMTKYI